MIARQHIMDQYVKSTSVILIHATQYLSRVFVETLDLTFSVIVKLDFKVNFAKLTLTNALLIHAIQFQISPNALTV